jgi:cobalt/nickel transport system permease protein
MHHVVLERWSRGRTFLHRRDARAKMASALVMLVAIATVKQPVWLFAAGCFGLLLSAAAAGRLPITGLLWRTCVVLPFAAVFAFVTWAAGDAARAETLVVKSYLSALTAITLAALTPLPALLTGLEKLGAPRFLLLVTHFVYRYLFVLAEEAQHMRVAALSRGATDLKAARRAAAGAIAVLFVRSYERSDAIHQAMLARGFQGRFGTLGALRFGAADLAFVSASAAAVGALWVATGGPR